MLLYVIFSLVIPPEMFRTIKVSAARGAVAQGAVIVAVTYMAPMIIIYVIATDLISVCVQ
jgi:hypothetical protein